MDNFKKWALSLHPDDLRPPDVKGLMRIGLTCSKCPATEQCAVCSTDTNDKCWNSFMAWASKEDAAPEFDYTNT